MTCEEMLKEAFEQQSVNRAIFRLFVGCLNCRNWQKDTHGQWRCINQREEADCEDGFQFWLKLEIGNYHSGGEPMIETVGEQQW